MPQDETRETRDRGKRHNMYEHQAYHNCTLKTSHWGEQGKMKNVLFCQTVCRVQRRSSAAHRSISFNVSACDGAAKFVMVCVLCINMQLQMYTPVSVYRHSKWLKTVVQPFFASLFQIRNRQWHVNVNQRHFIDFCHTAHFDRLPRGTHFWLTQTYLTQRTAGCFESPNYLPKMIFKLRKQS